MFLGSPVHPAPPKSFNIERAERDEIRAAQSLGLRRLVERSWRRIPFYRSLWKAAGVQPQHIISIDDVRALPIVTKRQLEESLTNDPPFGTHQGNFRALRVQASSGSTGKPKPFFQTPRDWQNITNFWARRLYAQGVRRGDIVQISLTYALFIPGFTSTEGAMKLGTVQYWGYRGHPAGDVPLRPDLQAPFQGEGTPGRHGQNQRNRRLPHGYRGRSPRFPGDG